MLHKYGLNINLDLILHVDILFIEIESSIYHVYQFWNKIRTTELVLLFCCIIIVVSLLLCPIIQCSKVNMNSSSKLLIVKDQRSKMMGDYRSTKFVGVMITTKYGASGKRLMFKTCTSLLYS